MTNAADSLLMALHEPAGKGHAFHLAVHCCSAYSQGTCRSREITSAFPDSVPDCDRFQTIQVDMACRGRDIRFIRIRSGRQQDGFAVLLQEVLGKVVKV